MPSESIDLESPDLGKELLKHANGDLPISVWRHYVFQHWPRSHPQTSPSLIEYCDESPIKALDPQWAVDKAYGILLSLLFPESSHKELVKGLCNALGVLSPARSSLRKKPGHPKSIQHQAVRAYLLRKFNPDPNKPGGSTLSWPQVADKLFNENGRCPRCGTDRHQYGKSPCIKALTEAVSRLHAAMEHEGIPI